MDLSYTKDEIAFRDEVRSFLDEKLPEELSAKVASGAVLSKAEHDRWHAILNEKGWLAPNWPEEYGGCAWNAVQRHIFEEESARANAPRIVPFGLSMLAPVLMKFGSDAQRDHYLPRILSGEDWWCQGYSEPGAGSDLASLKTRAVRDGDHYIVNGQKTWTTLGQYANKIFCLVRTDPNVKQQEGISFLLIDMDTPGIEVRPIKLLDGTPEVNEVWFTDVRVPAENLVGEENMGWTYAKYLLTHERTSYAHIAGKKAEMAEIGRIMAEPGPHGPALAEDADFRRRYASVEAELATLEATTLRTLASVSSGEAPGDESSILKVRATEVAQAITELKLELAAWYGLRAVRDRSRPDWNGGNDGEFAPPWTVTGVADYFFARAQSIYGGSNEIQKNVIAKQVLGL